MKKCLITLLTFYFLNSSSYALVVLEQKVIGTWRGEAVTKALCIHQNLPEQKRYNSQFDLKITPLKNHQSEIDFLNIVSGFGCFKPITFKGFMINNDIWAASEDRRAFLLLKWDALSQSFSGQFTSKGAGKKGQISFSDFKKFSYKK